MRADTGMYDGSRSATAVRACRVPLVCRTTSLKAAPLSVNSACASLSDRTCLSGAEGCCWRAAAWTAASGCCCASPASAKLARSASCRATRTGCGRWPSGRPTPATPQVGFHCLLSRWWQAPYSSEKFQDHQKPWHALPTASQPMWLIRCCLRLQGGCCWRQRHRTKTSESGRSCPRSRQTRSPPRASTPSSRCCPQSSLGGAAQHS